MFTEVQHICLTKGTSMPQDFLALIERLIQTYSDHPIQPVHE